MMAKSVFIEGETHGDGCQPAGWTHQKQKGAVASPQVEVLQQPPFFLLAVSQPNRVKKKGVLLDTPVAKKAKELNIDLDKKREKVNLGSSSERSDKWQST